DYTACARTRVCPPCAHVYSTCRCAVLLVHHGDHRDQTASDSERHDRANRRAVQSKAWAQSLATSRTNIPRSLPRPLSCVLVNHLLHLDDQLPILGKPILPCQEMVKQGLRSVVRLPNTGIIVV